MFENRQHYIHSLFEPRNILVVGQITNSDIFIEACHRDNQLLVHPARFFSPAGSSLFSDTFFPLLQVFNHAAYEKQEQADLFDNPALPSHSKVYTLDYGVNDNSSLNVYFSNNALWGFQSAAHTEADFYEESKSEIVWIDPHTFGFDKAARENFESSFKKLIQEFRCS